MKENSMSKKAAIAGMAITSIAASDNLNTQICIVVVGLVCVIVQAVLDYGKGGE